MIPDFSTANLERNADLRDQMGPLDDSGLLRVIAVAMVELRQRHPKFTIAQLAVEIAKTAESIDDLARVGIT